MSDVTPEPAVPADPSTPAEEPAVEAAPSEVPNVAVAVVAPTEAAAVTEADFARLNEQNAQLSSLVLNLQKERDDAVQTAATAGAQTVREDNAFEAAARKIAEGLKELLA